jgi:hypothetical protein
MGRLPEAWLAPPAVRELRELVRYRAKLVALRSGLKAQVHAVLAKQGVRVPMSDLFGVAGGRLLDEFRLGRAYGPRVASLRTLLVAYDQEITMLGREIASALAGDVGYLAIQAIPGVGPVLAAVFVAEIGDVHRFTGAPQLCSWAGLTPQVRNSDRNLRHGHITKAGLALGTRDRAGGRPDGQRHPMFASTYAQLARPRGSHIATTAIARRLLARSFHILTQLATAPAPEKASTGGARVSA